MYEMSAKEDGEEELDNKNLSLAYKRCVLYGVMGQVCLEGP